MLWSDTESTLQAGAALANGDRRTMATYTLSSTTAQHVFRPLISTREHRVAGAWTMFGKTAKTWDATLRAMLTEEVWFTTADATRAITRFVYDMTTGNVMGVDLLRRRKADRFREVRFGNDFRIEAQRVASAA